jgi:hypothetical protein
VSNRKLLLKTREQAGIRSSTQTLKEDIRLFGYAIPNNLLSMDRQDFWRHFNKLYQTNGILTNLYATQLSKEGVLQEYQIEVIREFLPGFGE